MKASKGVAFVCLLSAMASCASEYHIQGNSSVSLLDGKMLFVKVPRVDGLSTIDSAEVVHGNFTMSGAIDSTMVANLYMDENSIMPFVVEQGRITMTIDNALIKVSGTPLNNILYDYIAQKTSIEDRAYEVNRLESRMIMNGEPVHEVERKINHEKRKLGIELDELTKKYIQDNYDNVLGPGIFIMMCNSMPYPMLTPLIEDVYDEAPESFKNHPMVKRYMEMAAENQQHETE